MADSESSTDTASEEVPKITEATEELESACPVADQSATEVPVPQVPRENLVATAVSFLENPRVQGSPLSQKRAFLLKKGLTPEEIDAAIERAKVWNVDTARPITSPPLPPPPPPPPPPHLLQPEYSLWSQLSHFSSSVVIVGVACYGAYYVYKKYVEPYLKGWDGPRAKPDRLSQVQDQISALTEAIQQLREAVSSLESAVAEDKLQRKPADAADTAKQDSAISELKSEVLSVKALLLSRNQFPSAPKVTPPAASIPTWQLSSNGTSKKENGTTAQANDSEEEEEQSEDDAKEPAVSRKEELLQNRPTGLA
uniref:Peroxisomal membrane protein PEX14 n=1 Tax=Amblyomma aureolatum TaxID=187763 RepID=A0A1E1XBW3_9ACAR